MLIALTKKAIAIALKLIDFPNQFQVSMIFVNENAVYELQATTNILKFIC